MPSDPSPPNQPGLFELFLAFAKMSLAGFGGVLVWARRSIVEQRRWMTAEEFNETLALCHFLPGPNIVNLSVVFRRAGRAIDGDRDPCWPRSTPATAMASCCAERLQASPVPRSGCCLPSSSR
ncbi:chromate transporter [Bradyrhizobium sp. USDA 4473]